jgi:hypothetical protein
VRVEGAQRDLPTGGDLLNPLVVLRCDGFSTPEHCALWGQPGRPIDPISC